MEKTYLNKRYVKNSIQYRVILLTNNNTISTSTLRTNPHQIDYQSFCITSVYTCARKNYFFSGEKIYCVYERRANTGSFNYIYTISVILRYFMCRRSKVLRIPPAPQNTSIKGT